MENYVQIKKREHSISVAVKKEDSHTQMVWNAPKICFEESCPIVSRCECPKEGGVCSMHKNYLESIYISAIDILGIGITTRDAVRLGMHIIPLYSILFELKLAVAACTSVYTVGRDSGIRINPIYKELREHIKCIDDMWKNLGFKQLAGFGTGNTVDGDSDYCENLFIE